MSLLKQKRFQVSDENIEYIQDFKALKNLVDDSAALRLIVKEHADLKNHSFDLNYIVQSLKIELIQSVSEFIKVELIEELRRVRLGTNNTDRNSQILIELLSNLMVIQGIDQTFDTNKINLPFLIEAKEIVHNRITHSKQKKDDKLNARKGENSNEHIQ